MMAHSLQFRAFNVARLASHLNHFFHIWNTLVQGGDDFPLRVRNNYSPFWATLRQALFQVIINNCVMIDDGRSDGHNLSKIVNELIANKIETDVPLIAMKKELRDVAKPIANRVKLLRNNLFAHRSINITYRQAMEKAAIAREDLQTIVEIYVRISDAILVQIFRQQSRLDDSGFYIATRRLLTDLVRIADASAIKTVPKSET